MNKRIWIPLALLLLLLVAAVVFVSIELSRSKQENIELTKNFELDRQELEDEYTSFAKKYDELQFTIQNDSLAHKLTAEKAKVQHLLEELKSVKASNASEIRRLKKELATLRKVLFSYVQQIDSLNRENQGLRAQTQEMTQKYEAAAARATNLAQEKEDLSERVSRAAQLDATGISLLAKNKKGKKARKMKDVQQLQVDFTIARNPTAYTGMRAVYIRIVKPNNTVLGRGDTFRYENRALPYSIKKMIEYTGEETPLTVYWDVDEFLYEGSYRVEIFSDGLLIGTKTFTLD